MNDLQKLSLIVGAIIVCLSLPCLLVPQKAKTWIASFPRSRVAAWFLTLICTVWVTRLLFVTPLGFFESYKPSLYLLAPLFFVLTVVFMEELLAPRALGGIMLLVPCLIINIARQRGIMLVSLAYVQVIVGIMLVLSPYLFRKAMAFWIENTGRCKTLGMLAAGIGAAVAAFGLLFY